MNDTEWESMIPETCPAGIHANWAHDSDDDRPHACPWCRIAELEAELAEARQDQEWLGYLNQAGIDNSPAYDYACQLRREARAAVAAEAGEPTP